MHNMLLSSHGLSRHVCLVNIHPY